MNNTNTPPVPTPAPHPQAAEIVAAIRSHEIIGRGTCSPIDECYTDAELVAGFGFHYSGEMLDLAGAVAAALLSHELFVEKFDEVNAEAGEGVTWYGGYHRED